MNLKGRMEFSAQKMEMNGLPKPSSKSRKSRGFDRLTRANGVGGLVLCEAVGMGRWLKPGSGPHGAQSAVAAGSGLN
jgi:hypothetical protein